MVSFPRNRSFIDWAGSAGVAPAGGCGYFQNAGQGEGTVDGRTRW